MRGENMGLLGKTLTEEKVLDNWGITIPGAQGRENEVFESIMKEISQLALPGVDLTREDAAAGFLKGLFGQKREFLFIRNREITDYKIYVGVRSYGKTLDVSWFVTFEPGFFRRGVAAAKAGFGAALGVEAIIYSLDMFKQQDLRAFASVVHHAVLDVVEKTMASLGQDTSKIDRRSKGSLRIS